MQRRWPAAGQRPAGVSLAEMEFLQGPARRAGRVTDGAGRLLRRLRDDAGWSSPPARAARSTTSPSSFPEIASTPRFAGRGSGFELLPRPGSGELVFDFSFWDALACYFRDPAGSIVELIAHRGLGERGTRGAFSGEELLGLSEVGLVGDMASMSRDLEQARSPRLVGLGRGGPRVRRREGPDADPQPCRPALAADRPARRAAPGRRCPFWSRGRRGRHRAPPHRCAGLAGSARLGDRGLDARCTVDVDEIAVRDDHALDRELSERIEGGE